MSKEKYINSNFKWLIYFMLVLLLALSIKVFLNPHFEEKECIQTIRFSSGWNWIEGVEGVKEHICTSNIEVRDFRGTDFLDGEIYFTLIEGKKGECAVLKVNCEKLVFGVN